MFLLYLVLKIELLSLVLLLCFYIYIFIFILLVCLFFTVRKEVESCGGLAYMYIYIAVTIFVYASGPLGPPRLRLTAGKQNKMLQCLMALFVASFHGVLLITFLA